MIKKLFYNLCIHAIRFLEKASSYFYSPTESAYLWKTIQKRSTLATVKYIEEKMTEDVLFCYNRNRNLNFSII